MTCLGPWTGLRACLPIATLPLDFQPSTTTHRDRQGRDQPSTPHKLPSFPGPATPYRWGSHMVSVTPPAYLPCLCRTWRQPTTWQHGSLPPLLPPASWDWLLVGRTGPATTWHYMTGHTLPCQLGVWLLLLSLHTCCHRPLAGWHGTPPITCLWQNTCHHHRPQHLGQDNVCVYHLHHPMCHTTTTIMVILTGSQDHATHLWWWWWFGYQHVDHKCYLPPLPLVEVAIGFYQPNIWLCDLTCKTGG